ncbi:MAG: hypothetical protein HY735_19125 [Verrucomicrobia bacterium]|nr:hypothetical protein [Verrucomicrobiota bacterium]
MAWKRVLQGIGNQFVDDQPAGDGRVESQDHVVHVHLHLNSPLAPAVGLDQTGD